MIDKPIFDFVTGGWGIKLNTPDDPTLGLYLANGIKTKVVTEEEACNQITKINFTGAPGTASALYYSLVFMLSGDGWHVAKMDEWIEVSPTFQEYYQRTMATKKQLEGQIKEGLASAASAVADYELVEHDLRKYAQMVKYFQEKDEHALRAMFIDQVDVHTGGMSMIKMAARWSTIIADFFGLTDEEDSVDKITKKLPDVSRAEAVVLTTKNKLYLSWKKTFSDVVIGRYETLKGLATSRQRSIEEYRTWLKPYISRYKMTKIGAETSHGRSGILKSFADIAGTSTFSNSIRIATWKPLKPSEARQLEYPRKGDFIVHPYDPWIREHMILNKKTGLAKEYEWLANERVYCRSCKEYHLPDVKKCTCGSVAKLEKRTVADEIVEKEILPPWIAKEDSLDPLEMYYTYTVVDVFRAGSRLPVGEVEDITFSIYTYAISQNIMLVKLLELKCREREFERYIDEILGLRIGEESVLETVKKDFPALFEEPTEHKGLDKIAMDLKKITDDFSQFFKRTPRKHGRFMFVKPGPYERDFNDRITKYYLNVSSKGFNLVANFLKSKMGVG